MKQILINAMRAGVKLELDGDNLRISAQPGSMSEALIQDIRKHKTELIELLRKRQAQALPAEMQKVIDDPDHRHDPFPLTDVQHAYWLGRIGVAESGNVSTHLYHELDCPELDIGRFNRALQRVIERHDMLRAVIEDDGTQRVLPAAPAFEVRVHDARQLSEPEAQRIVLEVRETLAAEVRPADRWPLFDIHAVRMPNSHVRLHLSLDMLILDGWSMSMMFEELLKLYRSPETPSRAMSLTFRDYVLAERKLLEGASYRRARDYWLERVETLPSAPELPGVAAPIGTPRFARRDKRLARDIWAALKHRAREHGLTPSNLLMAVYAEVLARWSGSSHFTLNLTLFNRLPVHPDIMQVLGDFTSLVMVEVDHRQAGTSFVERAQRLQQRLMTDLDHREFSGVEVLREWRSRKQGGARASMPVVFTSALVLGEDGNEFEFGGAEEQFGSVEYAISQTPHVWLDNQAMEVRGELLIMWDSVDAVFAPGVVDEMFGAQLRLLLQLANEESAWTQAAVAGLPDAMQQRRLLANATESAFQAKLLQADFVEAASRTPDAIAVITAGRTLSYRQLLSESVALARRLQQSGLQPGELVAVMMHKGWEQVVGVMAALIAGAAYLPVDAALPAARRRSLLEIGDVRHVLTQAGAAAHNETDGERFRLHPVAPCAPAFGAIEIPAASRTPADLAYVIFTSGTTGIPKGVMIEHRAAWNTIAHINRMYCVRPEDRILAVSSLSFDLSVYDIFGMLGAGAALVIPEHGAYLDPKVWKNLMKQHKVSLWNSTPQLMRMLVDTFGPDQIATAPLREVLLSGDWIPLDLPASVKRHFLGAHVTGLGGATEASIWSNYFPVAGIHPEWASIPYGKPLPNQTMRVLDAQMRPCPDHTVGRIHIGGIGLARGYWRDADKTAERFITDPNSGERMYDTGDLGRYAPDGNIIFLGRADSQVKIRGHRVEPGEVAAILRRHPAVAEAAVTIIATSKERKELVAYLELSTERSDFAFDLQASTGALAIAGRPLRQYLECAHEASTARPMTPSLNQTWHLLEQLYFSAMLDALGHFGVRGTIGERIDVEALLAKGIASRYHRWLQRALNALAEDGIARPSGHRCVVLTEALPESKTLQLLAQVKQRLQADLLFSAEEAAWFCDSIGKIPDVLTEKLHSAQLYANENAARLYQKLFPDSHADLARVVRRLASAYDEPLNVLEVGGGLGAATQHVLPVLNEHGCLYTFTDISEFFLARAQRMFDSDQYAIEFGLLDVDIRPDFQGYSRQAYDMVLALSMLHDVCDTRRALDTLFALLKPGGHVVILEQTRFFRSFDLAGGLQQDFDSFEDESLRSAHCLLSCDQWKTVLQDAGFVDVAVLGQPGSVADTLGFHVIVAGAPSTKVGLNIQAVTDYLSSQLPDYMAPHHIVHMDRIPMSSNGKIDYRALPPIPERASLPNCKKVAPRTDTEQALLDIWLRIMHGHEIGVTDNFFDIGGDSLIATQVIREINASMSFNLEMNDFFENMSIEALAKLYDNREIVVDLL